MNFMNIKVDRIKSKLNVFIIKTCICISSYRAKRMLAYISTKQNIVMACMVSCNVI